MVNNADAAFEGGGVEGIAFVGALQAFEEAGFQWQKLAGTSAGAIIATLVAVGCTAIELKEVMDQIDFRKFKNTNVMGRMPLLGP